MCGLDYHDLLIYFYLTKFATVARYAKKHSNDSVQARSEHQEKRKNHPKLHLESELTGTLSL
jgi:hypothetical protein